MLFIQNIVRWKEGDTFLGTADVIFTNFSNSYSMFINIHGPYQINQ